MQGKQTLETQMRHFFIHEGQGNLLRSEECNWQDRVRVNKQVYSQNRGQVREQLENLRRSTPQVFDSAEKVIPRLARVQTIGRQYLLDALKDAPRVQRAPRNQNIPNQQETVKAKSRAGAIELLYGSLRTKKRHHGSHHRHQTQDGP